MYGFASALVGELHHAIREGEEGVVTTQANVFTGMYSSTTLANQNVTGYAILAAINFDAQSFAF
jgi:hypothetical protein